MTPEQRAIWLAGRTKHGGYAGGAESSEHAIWRGALSRWNTFEKEVSWHELQKAL